MSLGGVCVVRRLLTTVHTDKKLFTEAQIDAGFDFIEDNAPMKSSNNAHIRWIMKQKNNPESPRFEWPENKIKEAVHNLQSGTSLAKVINNYPLTLFDMKNWVLTSLLRPCLRTAMHKSTILASMSGIGKTPLACALASSMSHYNIKDKNELEDPAFRTASHLDFFRSEPGSVFVPIIYDDGDISCEVIASLKAFFDVAAEDAKVQYNTYASW